MKKMIALCMVTILCISLVACGGTKGPNGTYKDNHGFSTITFSGNKVEYLARSSEEPSIGTFSMDGNKVSVEYSKGTKDDFIYDEETDTLEWGEGILIFSKVK